VDRRSEPRFDAQKQLVLTLLEEHGLVQHALALPALAIEMSEGGMRLLLTRAIPVGAPVKIEAEDSLFLGEVCYCESQATGFLIGLKLLQVLSNLSELARLNRRIMGDEPRAPESTAVRSRR
jgi:hypothetical protein